jgi:HD-GYP domain-containing protein (c-di-GMP phosphodiesterase class II)
MRFKYWKPFTLFLTHDTELEKRLSQAFEGLGEYFSTQNSRSAFRVFDKKRVDILLIDEAHYMDLKLDKKYRDYIFELYRKAVEKNPKIITIILFENRKSNFMNEFQRKSEVLLKLDRNKVQDSQITYITQIFAHQVYRSIPILDIPDNFILDVPLYSIDDNTLEFIRFLDAGENFLKEHRLKFEGKGVNRIFVENHNLSVLFKKNNFKISEELHQIRKLYKFFLSYFLDDSKDEQTFVGKTLHNVGEAIIKKLKQMIGEFRSPMEALDSLPYLKFSELHHGINSAIYILIFGKHCFIEDLDSLALAALIHDQGKFGINYTLHTHGKVFGNLADDIAYREHPKKCLELVDRKKIKLTHAAREAILSHHENFDATGYPKAIGGTSLSEEASLLALCDVFDHVITVHRYNNFQTLSQAWSQILEIHHSSLLGAKFNPDIIAKLDDFFNQVNPKKKAS